MSDRTPFSITDLKRAFATKSSPEHSVKLCYSQAEVYIKPLKIKDKKEVLKAIESKNEVVINKALDEILEKYCEMVDGTEFSVNKLTSQERQQLLVHIRCAAAGETVKIMHECPTCGHINKDLPYSLKNMVVKNYVKPAGDDTIKLANDSIFIKLSPITREKELEIERYVKKNKIVSSTEKNFILMAGVIKSIEMAQDDIRSEVKLSIDELIEFFENLPASELEKISEYFKNNDFGIKMPLDFKCEKCGHEGEEEVNVAVFFIV
jgi:predicted RNA-binding Zn-ribbon protein involved in translation (DUF1610 family)